MNATDTSDQPKELVVDNLATGVEEEDSSRTLANSTEPWDPDKIRVDTRHYALRHIVDMIADKDLDLAPDFQRSYV